MIPWTKIRHPLVANYTTGNKYVAGRVSAHMEGRGHSISEIGIAGPVVDKVTLEHWSSPLSSL